MSADLESRVFTRRGNALVPADWAADEMLAKIPEGRSVTLSVRKPRNPDHLRRVFALMRIVLDNTEGKWLDETHLLDDLKLATGLFQTRINTLTGIPYVVAGSISFGSMSQERFSVWYEAARAKMADVLGITPDELEAHLDDMNRPVRRAG